jgi:hypothetical protein
MRLHDVFIVERTSAYHELDDLDQQSLHAYYEDKGKVVNYCRIIPEGHVYIEVMSAPYLDCDIYHAAMIRRKTDVSTQTI